MASRTLKASLLSAALFLALASCNAPPMSPALRAQHTAALQQVEDARGQAELAIAAREESEALLASAMQRGKELESQLATVEASPGEADPAAVSALVAELTSLSDTIGLADAARSEAEAQLELARTVETVQLELATDIEEQAIAETGGAIMDLVGTIFPPAKGLSDLWLLLGGLAFKRPRDRAADAATHLGKALASGVKLDATKSLSGLVDAMRSMGATLGLKHTTDDPHELVANAARLAAESPDVDLPMIQFALDRAYLEKVERLGRDPAGPLRTKGANGFRVAVDTVDATTPPTPPAS